MASQYKKHRRIAVWYQGKRATANGCGGARRTLRAKRAGQSARAQAGDPLEVWLQPYFHNEHFDSALVTYACAPGTVAIIRRTSTIRRSATVDTQPLVPT